MLSDPMFWIAAVAAVLLLGLAKGGFAGLGALATPILALAIAPTTAAAILLPILIVQDAISVWSFRKAYAPHILIWMLPGAVIGVMLGYGFAAMLPASGVMAALGLITLLFGLYRLWTERKGQVAAMGNSTGWIGSLFGIMAGFTSQIAHAGGPPFQMWVAPQRLPHQQFVGTGAIFFAALNLIKLPAYLALGEFTQSAMTAAAALMPLAIISTIAGVWVIRRIDPARFYTIIYGLMVLLGAKLIFDAF